MRATGRAMQTEIWMLAGNYHAEGNRCYPAGRHGLQHGRCPRIVTLQPQQGADAGYVYVSERASDHCGKRFCVLRLLHEFRLQLHRADAFDPAINVVVAVDQADVLDPGADLYHV